jgi:hypothetical protein
MRIIIIIQTVIILLGAYYFYMQSPVQTVLTAPVVPTLQPATSTGKYPGYEPPTGNPPGYEAEVIASSSVNVSASDAGMEYPTMDEGTPQAQ